MQKRVKIKLKEPKKRYKDTNFYENTITQTLHANILTQHTTQVQTHRNNVTHKQTHKETETHK